MQQEDCLPLPRHYGNLCHNEPSESIVVPDLQSLLRDSAKPWPFSLFLTATMIQQRYTLFWK
jgi:hypothetical protein